MANKIVGTPGDDVLKGTKKKDIIKGKGGNDVIKGKGGNDVLKGGKGDDELKGGKGNDDLKGQGGDDLLLGNKGADDHWGGPGADIFKFKNGDGFWDGFPSEAGPGGFDDIIWDYQDGIDKFDVPVVEIPPLDNGAYDDPVGGSGFAIGYGATGGSPLFSGGFFVSGIGADVIDITDFI